MSIADIVLFVSTLSKECGPCISFVINNKIPINIVRLDTKTAREKVLNGKYFQITTVPSLLVTRDTGDIQIFTSKEKIISWIKNTLLQPPKPKVSVPMEEEPEIEVQEEEEEETRIEKKPKNIQTGLYSGSSKKKKKSKKSKSQEAYTEVKEEDFDQIPDAQIPDNLVFVKPNEAVKPNSANILNLAKQMEEDRKTTLGYNTVSTED